MFDGVCLSKTLSTCWVAFEFIVAILHNNLTEVGADLCRIDFHQLLLKPMYVSDWCGAEWSDHSQSETSTGFLCKLRMRFLT